MQKASKVTNLITYTYQFGNSFEALCNKDYGMLIVLLLEALNRCFQLLVVSCLIVGRRVVDLDVWL